MADLEGKTIAETYRSVLNVGTANNQELDTTPRVIADGAGNASPLYLATDEVLINSTNNLTFNATGSGEYIYGDGTDLRLNSGADILLMSTGKVGVNSTGPTGKFEVISSTSGEWACQFVQQHATGYGVLIDVDTSDAHPALKITEGSNVLFNVDDNGKIGIGTASPSVTATRGLDIENTTTNSTTQGGCLRLGANDDTVMISTDRLGVIEFAGNESGTGDSAVMTVGARIEAVADATWSGSENGASLDFYTTDGNAAQAQHMTILANGKVGIDSSAPGHRFEVISNASAEWAGNFVQQDAGGYGVRIDVEDADVDPAFLVESGGVALFNVDGNGKVGLGTNTPAARLSIVVADSANISAIEIDQNDSTNNRISIYSDHEGSGDMIYMNGSAGVFYVKSDGDCENTNDNYDAVSDRRVKDNIVDATPKLDDLNKLKIRNWNFNNNVPNDGRKCIGVIADEAKEVFPSLVTTKDDREYDDDGNIIRGYEDRQGFRYAQLVPILVKAVQELSAKVEALENA